ncbi:hypothetical protein CY35_18G034600 [Sphagnum magellanicum]|jgi:lipocalin|nr:hypothetical protein CY35_18G034600 [Sphagnum magellanicum]
MAVCSPTSASMLTRSSSFTSVQWSQIASRCEPCTIRNVEVRVRCSVQSAVVTSMAAMLLTASSSQVVLAELHSRTGNMCQIAALPDTSTVLQLDTESGNEEGGPAAMTAGMTMRNFNPARYAGRWFEVASLKLGFAGQGQEDCHCTQGVYTFDEKNQAIQVETFCVHGSPTGYITGIRGRVQCVTDAELSKLKISEFERMQMIRQKCFLRFPNLPFIPRQPYNVIATDYDNYALVSGAKDASFIQIYSRTPNPGREFIDTQKKLLGTLGYDEEDIKDTPQDCEETSMNDLQSMMANPGLENAMSNRFSSLGLSKGVQLNPFTSSLETLRKLIELYVPKFN